MTPSARWIPLALLAGAVAVGACSSGEPLPLTLEASADAGKAIVTYDVGGGPVTETVTTPWSLPVEVSGRFSVSLRVENPDDHGLVRCGIVLAGASSPSGTGESAVTCDLAGTSSGDTLTTSGSAIGEERETPDSSDEGSDPSEVDIETLRLVGGLISLEVPSDWEQPISSPAVLATSTGALERRAFTPDALDPLLGFEDPVGSGILTVFRLDTPLAFAPDADLADEIIQDPAFGETPIGPSEATISGRPTVRIGGATELRIELDLVTIGDARFAIRMIGYPADDVSWERLRTIRDSIVFDETAIPPLVHSTEVTTTLVRPDGSESRIVVEAPADWVLDDTMLADPDSGPEMRIDSEPLDGRTIDDVLGAITDRVPFDRSVEFPGFESSAISRTDTDGDQAIDNIVVVATVGDVLLVLEVRDTSPDPDFALLEAIVSTLEVRQ